MSSANIQPKAYDFSRASRFGLRGRMISNTGLLGGARLVAAIMGVATLIITAKALSDNVAFGTLLFIHAYMLFFSEIASFHIWQALIRFGSDEVKATNAPRLSRLIKTGLILDAVAACLAFLAAVLFFGVFLWVKSLIGDETGLEISGLKAALPLKHLVILYCTVILFRQINVAIGVFRLFDKFSVLALRALVMPSVRLIGVMIAAHQGWGLIGFLTVWFLASLLSYVVLQIFAAIEIYRRGFWPLIWREKICKVSEFPGLYSFIVKTNIDSTLNALKTNFPSLAVMLVFGPATLAIYRIAEEIARLLARGVTLFDQVLFPELSRMAVDVDFKTLSRTTGRAAIGIGIVGFVISTIVLLFGDTLLNSAFDESFSDASSLSVMLLISTSLIGIATPFYTVFYVMMRPGAAIWVRVIGTASFIGLFFLLASRFELFSIGLAAIAGAIIEVMLVIFMTQRIIRKKKNSLQA